MCGTLIAALRIRSVVPQIVDKHNEHKQQMTWVCLAHSLTPCVLFLCFSVTLTLTLIAGSTANPDAKRLYDDLLSNYNKLVRPVVNVTDALTVRIKLKLSQLIDVNLKNQIMTTNLWVEQSWYDYKLKWEPKEYGGVEMLHVPSDHIWRPDIVLYNKWVAPAQTHIHMVHPVYSI